LSGAGLLAGYVLPVGAAALAGALIGLDRELRGHPAGLRTHTLVSLVSALLMAAAAHPDAVALDPGRVAQGLLTGIGFLCGGVIFRQGLSVLGVTTATSLWAASAVGILFGVGAPGLAATGTVAVLAVLGLLRAVGQRLPASHILDVAVAYRREGPFPEAEFRAVLGEIGLKPQALRHRLVPEEAAIELGATLREPRGAQTGLLARRLSEDPRVVRFQIEPAAREP
jgi:putative Mg2+ transporter-C (MgtC) family protein